MRTAHRSPMAARSSPFPRVPTGRRSGTFSAEALLAAAPAAARLLRSVPAREDRFPTASRSRRRRSLSRTGAVEHVAAATFTAVISMRPIRDSARGWPGACRECTWIARTLHADREESTHVAPRSRGADDPRQPERTHRALSHGRPERVRALGELAYWGHPCAAMVARVESEYSLATVIRVASPWARRRW